MIPSSKVCWVVQYITSTRAGQTTALESLFCASVPGPAPRAESEADEQQRECRLQHIPPRDVPTAENRCDHAAEAAEEQLRHVHDALIELVGDGAGQRPRPKVAPTGMDDKDAGHGQRDAHRAGDHKALPAQADPRLDGDDESLSRICRNCVAIGTKTKPPAGLEPTGG